MQRLRWCTIAAMLGLTMLAWLLGGTSPNTVAQDVRRPPRNRDPRIPAEPAENPRTYTSVKEVHQKHHLDLIRKKGIVGVGIMLDPADKTKHALRIYTTGSPKPSVPAEIDGVPVYERYMTEGFKAFQPPPEQTFLPRPVPIGVSIANRNTPLCYSGTLGARLRRPRDGAVFIISNNHVIGLENDALLNDPIQQPSSGDINCFTSPFLDIARLTHFIPISFTLNNQFDVSIAQTTVQDVGVRTLFSGYGTPRRRPFAAPLGTRVQKFGRTTGQTFGTVTTIDVTTSVAYTNGIGIFIGQFDCTNAAPTTGPFGGPGDSGSLVVDNNNNPVGLLFAGSGNTATCNQIAPILAFYGMLVDDGGVFDPGTQTPPPVFKRLRPIGPPAPPPPPPVP